MQPASELAGAGAMGGWVLCFSSPFVSELTLACRRDSLDVVEWFVCLQAGGGGGEPQLHSAWVQVLALPA